MGFVSSPKNSPALATSHGPAPDQREQLESKKEKVEEKANQRNTNRNAGPTPGECGGSTWCRPHARWRRHTLERHPSSPKLRSRLVGRSLRLLGGTLLAGVFLLLAELLLGLLAMPSSTVRGGVGLRSLNAGLWVFVRKMK
jgi:hypothetical protein